MHNPIDKNNPMDKNVKANLLLIIMNMIDSPVNYQQLLDDMTNAWEGTWPTISIPL